MSSAAATRHTAGELLAGVVVLAAVVLFVAFAAVQTNFHRHADGTRLSAEFDDIGGLAPGSDVRIAGVKVGRVISTSFDSKSFRAKVNFSVAKDIQLPDDSSAQVASAGLLGGVSLNLVGGGSTTYLHNGQTMQITQSAANLEDLLGKFIFNVGNLADATQKQLQREQGAPKQ
jgi:phospholipid/cholesterol/gamma-HCH transport system substrate-binding protein